MKKLFTILLLLPLVCLAQTTTFNFTAIPLTTDFIRPDASATLWNEQDAFTGTIHIPVSGSPAQMQDAYHRFGMTEFFGNASASDSTIIFTRLDNFFNMAIDHKMGVRFRVMGLCNNCGNPPNDNFNGLVNYGGGWNIVPEFLHNLQQAESNPDNRDFFSTRGDQDQWVPNVNSWPFQRWVGKLSTAIKNHINSTSHNGVNYGDVLRIYDIGYYGCYSEQHSNCLCDQISDGNIPVGARHTDAGLMAIVNQQTNAFGGDTRWKIVIPFNAFDAMWLPHTYNTVTYGNFLLNHPDSIGWINDHIGANEGYDHDYLENNNRINNAKLMNRWKYSPTGGEPVEWGAPADRSAVPAYVQTYHMSFFGNGNLNGVITNNNTTEANNFRLASRRAGYRLRLTGGSANVGASLVINLDWLNEGGAPPYWNWTVQYLIKNGATTVSTLTSSFNPRYFQPSGASQTKTDAFGIPAIPAGTYGLYVIVKDPLNYRNPMPLAITPQQSDGSYFLGNITLPTAGTNQPPIANAGPNQSISTSSVSLNGSSSADPDGTIVTYAWTRQSGPNTPTIVSPSSANTNVTGLIAGVYVFNLTVTDNNGATNSDQVQITVSSGNQAPIANAGPNQSITVGGTSVDGSASTDDVGIVSYSWAQQSGPNVAVINSPTSAFTTLGNLIVGTYIFRLTVSDAGGLTAFDDVQITVTTGNAPPIANAGANITITSPATSTSLNGTLSTDDVGITAYLWTQVGGAAATIVSPTSSTTNVTGLTVGVYVFRLRVEDAGGLFSIDDVQVTVNATTPTIPVANAGPDKVIVWPINFVQLNGSGSTGTITTYQWTKVSGPLSYSLINSTFPIVNAESLSIGVYVFRLTVCNSAGCSFDDVTVTVLPEPNDPPIANAGGNQTITLPTSTTSVDGSASTDDVGIVIYAWTKVSGPSGGNISSSATAITNITSLQEGTYVFRLTVTDGGGLTDFDEVTIIVNPASNLAPVAIITTGTPTIQLPTNTVNLSGTSSTDDVAVTAYLWTQVSGPSQATIATPTGSTTNMNNLIEGVYFFQLQVSDAGGLTDTDIIMITVTAAVVVPPILDGRFLMRGLKFLPHIP